MQEHQIKIDFKLVDFLSLSTEDDFLQEAKRLLPETLVQLGEAVGEKTWEELQKGLKCSGVKVNNSPSEKRKFVKETGKNYRKKASARDRK
jgi:hypothetical protein